MLTLPSEILIEDESLRDGLQNEKRVFYSPDKRVSHVATD